MKKLLIAMAVLGFVLGISSLVMADNIATQTVTFQVDAINEIEVSGDPANLVINSATAGSEPDSVTDATTTWDITTNADTDAKKLTGAIDTNMPSNVTLKINLGAPTGASSEGQTALTNVAASLVTAIEMVAESGLSITYTLAATVAAGVVASDTRTVTLTLTDTT
ncbi:MAG: hypothetical protein KAW16_05990 [candidate division Zixibacteria bacterium]|nr:hypothetical protein [candidate division Zixibacteria bacterium]